MNKFVSFSLYLLIIICGFKLIAAKQLTGLDLKVDKASYLVGDTITADVVISNLPDKDVRIEVKARSNKNASNLLECIDCSPKLFKNKKAFANQSASDNPSDDKVQTIQFKWKAIEASRLTFFIDTNLNSSELDKTKTNFIEIGIVKSREVDLVSDVMGIVFFLSWSLCFWPQVISNYKNKSCVGLDLDYCALNFVGFLFYAVFNVSLYFLPFVKAEYERQNPYSNIPVLSTDVAFSIHHFLVSFYIYLQCAFIYQNGNQTYSKMCVIATTSVFSGFFFLGYYTLMNRFNLLDFVYYTGYVKMAFTMGKFIPQAYSNYKRKSTQGFSLIYVYLDVIGGSVCLAQMFVLIYNYEDWSFMTQNIAKTGIALLTLSFDVIFLIQHFVLYRNHGDLNKKVNYGSTQLGLSFKHDSNIVLFNKDKETNNNVV